jgi:polyisoprenoid-binding protein YceI
MRKILAFSIFALLAFSSQATDPVKTETTTYKANTSNSQIAWVGYKVTGKHMGTIALKDGALEFDGEKLTGGGFTIDMTTLTVTDLEGKMKDKLEGHLKSADFFGIENHPTASFEITKVAPRDASGGYKVTGDLTIKGITNSIKFNAVVAPGSDGKTATADIKVDRSEFDIKYGSGSFFDNLGDKTIYDEFDLSVTLALDRS